MHRNSTPMGGFVNTYAWYSWHYHGKQVNDSDIVGLIMKLRRARKNWRAEVIPRDYPSCIDVIVNGVTWLRVGH